MRRSRLSRIAMIAVPAAFGVACQVAEREPGEGAAAEGPATRAEVDRALRTAYDRFSGAYRMAQPDSVAALYAEDAYYLQPGSEILQGRDTVRAGFARFLLPFAERGEIGPEIRFDIVDRQVSGDLATDIGYYQIGESPLGRGKFIVIWKRGADGEWRIHADGYSNVDAPTGAGR